MKATFALVGAATLLAGTVFAGNEIIVKQRAKELSNQNNVRQGVTPPGATPPAPQTPSAPAPTQSAAIRAFQADLAALKADTPATAEQKQKMAQHVIAAAEGRAKPTAATASKFAGDVASAFAEKPLSAEIRARFVQDLDGVLNPAKYPQAKPDGIVSDVQAIFQANGCARKTATAIADDVRTLSNEVRNPK
jgi:hypothetical protein